MSGHDDLVRDLARLAGIADQHTDGFGQPATVPIATLRAILADFGLPCATEAEARDALNIATSRLDALIAPVIPVEAGRNARISLARAPAETAGWRLVDEQGVTREGRGALTNDADGAALHLPAIAPGYHRLMVEAGGAEAHATLIAAPRRAYEPPDLRGDAKLWGVTAQVYGLRAADDFGIGGYREIGQLAEGAGAAGAVFTGLSPLHALFGSDRTKISPYSPSSRLFLETLFIDPAAFGGTVPAELTARIEAMRGATLIDHAEIWAIKRPWLDVLWESFRETSSDEFARFRAEQGEALGAHATFEALSEHFAAQGRHWLGEWPEDHHQADSAAVRAFAGAHEERVAFHAWLQWLADRQLADAAARAHAAGQTIGLYRDLAVGPDRGGSEVWSHPDRFAPNLSIGAPPDPIAPNGQDWGLPPVDPVALATQGLAAFRDLVVANMRHAGAIRLDHAFQLARLFVIPLGAKGSEGAYITYPFEALVALLKLESHRARCLVIAEDLGNAPPGFSDAIMDAGIYSYRVLPFERQGDGAFKPPSAYPRRALAVATTHDLPTFVGWWRGLDIDLRQTLGVFDHDTAERERAARAHDRDRLSRALHQEGLRPDPQPPETPPFEEAMRYLARTDAALVGVQIEDIAGELNQPNMPGISEGHPNWRRRLSRDLDALVAPGGELARLGSAIAQEGRGLAPRTSALAAPPPRATYRLQFHKGFTFDDAVAIVPYLARLGISHVYASPIQTARPGSTHGYDIVDHSAINPELGGEDGFQRLSAALRENGLGLILDIVPNHMGVGGADNGWWLSTLEWGEASPHARAFDIDWGRLGADGKLVAPFLGERYGVALEQGDLKLAFDPETGSFSVHYFEHRFPLCPLTYPIILDRALAAAEAPDQCGDLVAISERLRTMAEETLPERRSALIEEAEALKARLVEAARAPAIRTAIDKAVGLINGIANVPESFGTLHRLLEAQSYRLAHWRVAASDINYRRFFDINSLAGLRVEDPAIFAATHALIVRLVREGHVQGLRIDHVDGLADPEAYLKALQAEVGPGFYIIVEKILEPGERLRSWPVAGTTGYDMLNLLDGVLINPKHAKVFDEIYRAAAEPDAPYSRLLREIKTEVLETSFASELEGLVSDLKRTANADRALRDITVVSLRTALAEIIARFPIYRTYLTHAAANDEDRNLILETIGAAKRHSALADRTVHDFIASCLLDELDTGEPGGPDTNLVRRFRRRFQQLTGPVMAKSFEDTLFYRYGRFLALNEVGGDPGHFGLTPEAFHAAMRERAETWPHALTATATHDTKRGEDARAKLIALADRPALWAELVSAFEHMTATALTTLDGAAAPDAADRFMLLQALIGAWPLELLDDGADEAAYAAFRERMEAYIVKALREGKRHSSWINPDEAYEGAARHLLGRLIAPSSRFTQEIAPAIATLAEAGLANSLARTALKLTAPGIPDLYQGTEFWDFSLVDPDNRRPIDFKARATALNKSGSDWEKLLEHWPDGRIKQHLTQRLLDDRAAAPALYAEGDYTPLDAAGARAAHVLAFRREHDDAQLVVAVLRLPPDEWRGNTDFWADTTLALPAGTWRDVLCGRTFEVSHDAPLPAVDLFGNLPMAILRLSPADAPQT